MGDLSTVIALLAPLGILIYWIIGLCKDVTNKNWNGIITRLTAVLSAWLIVELYAHSSIDLGGHDVISAWGAGDALLAALIFAATAGTGSDVLRTFNHADPNVQPKLVPPLDDTPVAIP